MKKEDRGSFVYGFLVVDKLKIILTPFNLIEILNVDVKLEEIKFVTISELRELVNKDGKSFRKIRKEKR